MKDTTTGTDGLGGYPTGRVQFPVKKVVGFHPAQAAAIDSAARKWFSGNGNEVVRAAVKLALERWEAEPPGPDAAGCR